MRRLRNFIKNFYTTMQAMGLMSAIRYQMGIAEDGVDFW